MLFSKLLQRKEEKQKASVPQKPAEPTETKQPYLTQTVVFGMHLYRSADEDCTVYFVDESRDIRKKLVDQLGNIQNFPGIVKEEFWLEEVSPNALRPQIRFRTSFEKRRDKWILLWQIQPDGRYWEDDDGFGAEKDSEVVLYTYVDMDGNYTAPFQLYSIGSRICCLDRFEDAHAKHYEEALRQLSAGKTDPDWICAMFPPLHGLELRVGFMSVSDYYSLWNRVDAKNYWNHPLLSLHLREMTQELLRQEGSITEIAAYPYHKILHSCMTLFWDVTQEPIFRQVLDKFFEGQTEEKTRFWLSAM